MKITQIDLKNFRAFYGEQTIKLKDGKSLLVLGENGSGKSSVYFALKDFFEAYEKGLDITKTPYRNLFAKTNDTSVKLSFDTGDTYEWSDSQNSPHSLTSQNLDVIRGFIDYKSLLETYFFQQKHDRVNIFDFIVHEVLADYQPLSSKRTIKQYWKRIRIPQRNTVLQLQTLSWAIDEFNQNLGFALKELEAQAQAIIDAFNMNLTLTLNFGNVGYNRAVSREKKALTNKLVNLRVKFYEQDYENHHQYLNEAKLSAVAIALYFASFLIRPQGKLNILALDDVLIGLDIANREFVLKIVDQYFKDFQLFIFTYDEVWFDRLQTQFADWQKLVFHTVDNGDFEIPAIKDQLGYLKKAEQLLADGDKRSAANMARQYFEDIAKGVCDKRAIKVRYRRKAKELKLDDLWKAILDVPGRVAIDAQLITDIKSDIATIYNPLSHGNPINLSTDDVKRAIARLKTLKQKFDTPITP
jgi:energy-coupling factor transporter ATP-binding protein EcfA2